MKKINLLTFAIAASAIIFASCKKKEEINPETFKEEIRQEMAAKVFDFDIRFESAARYYTQTVLEEFGTRMNEDDVIVLYIRDENGEWANMPYSKLDNTRLEVFSYKYKYPGSIRINVERNIGNNATFTPVTKTFRAVLIRASKVSRVLNYDQVPYSQIAQDL